MALTTCPDCGRELPSEAAHCPHCGLRLSPPPRHLKTHAWLATALLVGSYFGLVSQTDTRSAGPAIATAIFGALLVVAILYYVEVRIRSRHHRR